MGYRENIGPASLTLLFPDATNAGVTLLRKNSLFTDQCCQALKCVKLTTQTVAARWQT